MYLVFTRTPGESYRRQHMSFLCFCDAFRALIKSLVRRLWLRSLHMQCPPHDKKRHTTTDGIETHRQINTYSAAAAAAAAAAQLIIKTILVLVVMVDDGRRRYDHILNSRK